MKLANLAARAGRWSVLNRRRAILGWVAFVVLLTVAGGAVGMSTLSLNEKGIGESGRAEQTLNERDFARPAQERVLVESATSRAGQARFDDGVEALVSGLRGSPRSRSSPPRWSPAARRCSRATATPRSCSSS